MTLAGSSSLTITELPGNPMPGDSTSDGSTVAVTADLFDTNASAAVFAASLPVFRLATSGPTCSLGSRVSRTGWVSEVRRRHSEGEERM